MSDDELSTAGSVPPVQPAALERARQAVRAAADAEAAAEAEAAGRRSSRRRRRAAYGALAAAVAAGVTVAVVLTGGDPEPPAQARPEPSPVTRTGPLPDGGAASCAFAYSRETLAERAFAFDGTVTDIGAGSVTFDVHEWFRGGEEPAVTVAMADGAALADETSEWGPVYEVGTRLLVSGEPRWGGGPLDDPIVWTCGFTRYYDGTTAAFWRDVLG
ncbi:hypothetical protein [Jiangella mangrovi]|uniref:Uncharacterized protein n=1 Tax=Jiangella mangrovi TaxID=1524084 RepID=A0A7W9GSR1_9ACTN|nr:hypothetical protein [Jiangella mangrovi]MBB5789247.1 hypothetical protein [Jiangella mangrovi]